MNDLFDDIKTCNLLNEFEQITDSLNNGIQSGDNNNQFVLNLNDQFEQDSINLLNDDSPQLVNEASTQNKTPKSSSNKAKKRKKDTADSSKVKTKKNASNSQFKRRNIKKIFTEDKLNESTLKALEEEKQRQERLMLGAGAILSNDQSKNEALALNDLKQELKSENDQELNILDDTSTTFEKSSSDQSCIFILDDNNNSNNNNNFKIDEANAFKNYNIKKLLASTSNANMLSNNRDTEITILDDDDNDQHNSSSNEIIIEDDDCRVISESERQQDDQAKQKKKLRGIHMNDDLNQPDSNGQVLINVNHPVEDRDIYLPPFLSKNVKPHQIGGIRFIYDNIIESLSRVKNKDSGFGCILAHAMGLGKTFQTISFIEIFLRCTGSKRVLCIVPINTIQNWLSEFNYWLPENGQQHLDNDTIMTYNRPFKVFVINDLVKSIKQRVDNILNWRNTGGVLLIGYEMYRTLVNNSTDLLRNKSTKPKESLVDIDEEETKSIKLKEVQEALLTPCLVICDEGHRIKNSSANIAKQLQKIKTKRRVVLTGYPLQNNLIEYWCMVDFVRPSYLGTKLEFSNMFERPIMNGQCVDSTREDIKLMRFRAHVLHSLLEGFVQRRGHDVFLSSLPPKQEYVILLKLSPIQKQLYLAFIEAIGAMNQGEKSNPLRSFAICCKIWNHPDVLYKFRQLKDAGEIDLDLPDLNNQNINKQNDDSNKASSRKSKPANAAAAAAATKSTPAVSNYIHSSSPYVQLEDSGFNPFASIYNMDFNKSANKPVFDHDWSNKLLENYNEGILENGAKICFSLTLIENSVLMGDKILLFSQSLLSLNLIEDYLQRAKVPNVLNNNQKWEKNKNYYRLDGSTPVVERERLINSFNQTSNQVWLFLLSTKAGCLGINLIGANRVIVLDASWNPCHDAQAVCRVYRYGQKKKCFIYRLIADHTMEKKIYDRQISKQTMSDRVVDEIQTENHFTRTEVEKLIHFVKEDVPCADLSNLSTKYDDRILIESCLKHSNVITKEPFTHESLLIDKREYQLSEREKAMAFRNYNHDKKYFPYTKSTPLSLFYHQQQQQQQQQPQPQYQQYQHQNFYNSNNFYKNNQNNSYLDFNLNNSNGQRYSASLSHPSNPTPTLSELCSNNQPSIFYQTPAAQSVTQINHPNQLMDHPSAPAINTPQLPQSSSSGLNQDNFELDLSPNTNNQHLKDVKVSCFIAPSRIVIPSNQSNDQIVVQPGEKVVILKTQKGCYLRTQDKKIIALRNNSNTTPVVNDSSTSNGQHSLANLESLTSQQEQQQRQQQQQQPMQQVFTNNFNQNQSFQFNSNPYMSNFNSYNNNNNLGLVNQISNDNIVSMNKLVQEQGTSQYFSNGMSINTDSTIAYNSNHPINSSNETNGNNSNNSNCYSITNDFNNILSTNNFT